MQPTRRNDAPERSGCGRLPIVAFLLAAFFLRYCSFSGVPPSGTTAPLIGGLL
jgi:hypothetical protein